MSFEGFSICNGGTSLMNDVDLIDDHRNISGNNVSVSSHSSSSNNQGQIESLRSGINVSKKPIDAPSTRISSRGRRIKSKTDFLGVSLEYNLRQSSIVNRIKSELSRKAPKQPKPKSKPPPLSKYRRRAANARERGRMQEINEAFEVLRNLIPESEETPPVVEEPPPTSRKRSNSTDDATSKMTKITTLRQAMNYISALRELLKNGGEDTQGVGGVSDSSEYPDTSSACSILGNISPPFSSDEADLFVSDSCSDELGLLDSEGETWKN